MIVLDCGFEVLVTQYIPWQEVVVQETCLPLADRKQRGKRRLGPNIPFKDMTSVSELTSSHKAQECHTTQRRKNWGILQYVISCTCQHQELNLHE